MSEIYNQSDDHELLQEDFEAIRAGVTAYIERRRVRSTKYTDDMPEGDTPAKKYRASLHESHPLQALFGDEICAQQLRDFYLSYITPHRTDVGEQYRELITFTCEYNDGKLAAYYMWADIDGEGRKWTGEYFQDATDDWDIADSERQLTREDRKKIRDVASSLSAKVE